MKGKPELLAPAGKLSVLKAAVNVGADAVYFGLQTFNARNGATNFTFEDALSGLNYLHTRGKKGYITLNTLVKDKEIPDFLNTLKDVTALKPDGVIVGDLGAVSLIKKVSPDLTIHASTQMAVNSLEGVLKAYQKGIKRVVLARELSLDEILYIKNNTNCEIEVFIHGALCASYSGRCYMSSFIGGRSGNRGRCAQPCRLNYESMGKTGSLLSLKDMESVNHIKDLMGVDSLKIEGRLKNEYYVATVVDCYRKLIDGYTLSKDDIDLLYNIFNRGGYTDYFTKHNNMFCFNKNENPYSSYEEKAKIKYKEKTEDKTIDEKRKKPLSLEVYLSENNLPKVIGISGEEKHEALGDKIIEKAKNNPLTEEKVINSFSKLLDTPFYLKDIKVEIKGDLFMPLSLINELRRNLVSLFNKDFRYNNSEYSLKRREYKKGQYIARVANSEQLLYLNNNTDIKYIIADYNIVSDNLDKEKIVISLPLIVSPKEEEKIKVKLKELREKGFKYGIANNISNFNLFKDYIMFTDIYLNLTNSFVTDFLESENVKVIGVSNELNLREIKYFASDYKIFAEVYGNARLMTYKTCVKKEISGKCNKGPKILKDRLGEEFILDCDNECRNMLLNGHKTNMSDKVKDLENAGIDYYLLNFRYENIKEIDKIISDFKLGNAPEGKFTRGHFMRGVL